MATEEFCAEKTDEELVGLILENQDYFLCLMRRYEKKLLSYLKRLTSQRIEDLEDMLQEVFIKAYLNLNEFDRTLKFSSWVYRIAHNHAISHYRKQQARPVIVDDEDDRIMLSIADEFDIKKEMDRTILKNKINKALDGMDVKYKEVIILKYFEEKDYSEICDILKKPIGTVGTLLSRAKNNLKEKLRENVI